MRNFGLCIIGMLLLTGCAQPSMLVDVTVEISVPDPSECLARAEKNMPMKYYEGKALCYRRPEGWDCRIIREDCSETNYDSVRNKIEERISANEAEAKELREKNQKYQDFINSITHP